MIRAEHVASYYAATAHPWRAAPVLTDAVTCDVCVVGAGITGCSAALHLAERGYDVVLLEAKRVGWGASGRSGAQVIFGYARELDELVQLVGVADAERLWDMSLAAVRLVKDLIARHRIECDWRDGHMHAAIKPRQRSELRQWAAALRDRQRYALTLMEGDALRNVLNSPRYCAGVFDPNSGHLHPLNYTLGLAEAARTAGVRLYEDSAVLAYREGPQVELTTAHGRVRARYVVFAGNAYLDRLVPALARKIMPVGTYIAATESLGESGAKGVIPNDMAVTDMNFVLDYFRLSADHRLLFGGRVSYSTLPPPNLAATMRSRMARVFPQLRDVRIEYTWGGYVDISFNRFPHVGRLAPNLYFAQGFSGHGMALTGLTGQLIAEAVAGTAERFDVFARIPHRDFPGGRLFRLPALLLGTFYYRLRDLL